VRFRCGVGRAGECALPVLAGSSGVGSAVPALGFAGEAGGGLMWVRWPGLGVRRCGLRGLCGRLSRGAFSVWAVVCGQGCSVMVSVGVLCLTAGSARW